MSKSKKTPEQEEDTVEKEKPTGTPDGGEEPAKESPAEGKPEEKPADNPPEGKDDSEEKPDEKQPEGTEDSKKDEDSPGDEEKPEGEEKPKDEPAKAPEAPPADEASEREAQLQTQLLDALCRLAANAACVDPAKVGDAVILATAEAQKDGDLTEAGVTKAMANVLKRHPEWKTSDGDGKKSGSGGFKLGADPDKTGSGKKSDGKSGGKTKRWNRYK